MTKAVYVVGFVLVGLALWCAAIAIACKVAVLIGGNLGRQIGSGDLTLWALMYFFVPGALIGSVLNGTLGSMAVGNGLSRPDYSFYVMAVAFMVFVPAAVISIAFAWVAQW